MPTGLVIASPRCVRRARLQADRAPVALRGAGDATETGDPPVVGADGGSHLAPAAEEPLELARVQGDPADLPLELVADVGELGDDRHVRGEVPEHVHVEVRELAELVPPGVREVLVERDDPRPIRARHHPAPWLVEQSEPHLADELVVDVSADPQREVDLLRLEAGDLAAEDPGRRSVVRPWGRQQLVVALVAAEDGVGQVEEDDRALGVVGVALVLQPAGGHDVVRRLGLGQLGGVDRALGRDVVGQDLAGQRLVVDRCPAVPARALPEPLCGGVRVRLGLLESVSVGRPRRRGVVLVDRVVGGQARPVEGFRVRRVRLRPEPERLPLVRGEDVAPAGAGEDGHDRDVLAELAEASDEPAAGEGDVVRVRRDEDVGHGPASIPGAPPASRPHGPPAPVPRKVPIPASRPPRRAARTRTDRRVAPSMSLLRGARG